jgi:hypothetical protein
VNHELGEDGHANGGYAGAWTMCSIWPIDNEEGIVMNIGICNYQENIWSHLSMLTNV